MKLRMKASLIMIAAALMVLAFAVFPQNMSHAALEKTEFTFGEMTDLGFTWIGGATASDVITGAETSNAEVATVGGIMEDSGGRYYIQVEPYGVGTCDVTAYNGSTVVGTIKVTVEQVFVDRTFQYDVELLGFYYGTPEVYFPYDCQWEGTEYEIRIGSDKYTGTYHIDAPKSRKIKLKKMYKIGTVAQVTLKNDLEPNRSSTYTYKAKFESDTWVRATAKTKNKKALKVQCYNLHKGDVVKVTYGGKTYSAAIKKNFNEKTTTVKFYLKKKLKSNSTVKITINNKYKQKLLSGKYKMKQYDTGDPFADD